MIMSSPINTLLSVFFYAQANFRFILNQHHRYTVHVIITTKELSTHMFKCSSGGHIQHKSTQKNLEVL